ncbi:MAG: lycopene cyclase domain-containing protein [Bacteroidota bacterium]
MKFEYGIVLLLILLFPALLSFDKRLGLYSHKRAFLFTILAVCIPYWIWDIVATKRGHWNFHPDFNVGIILLGMPLEEWLFFVVITFVSIFTWEVSLHFLKRTE